MIEQCYGGPETWHFMQAFKSYTGAFHLAAGCKLQGGVIGI